MTTSFPQIDADFIENASYWNTLEPNYHVVPRNAVILVVSSQDHSRLSKIPKWEVGGIILVHPMLVYSPRANWKVDFVQYPGPVQSHICYYKIESNNLWKEALAEVYRGIEVY